MLHKIVSHCSPAYSKQIEIVARMLKDDYITIYRKVAVVYIYAVKSLFTREFNSLPLGNRPRRMGTGKSAL